MCELYKKVYFVLELLASFIVCSIIMILMKFLDSWKKMKCENGKVKGR